MVCEEEVLQVCARTFNAVNVCRTSVSAQLTNVLKNKYLSVQQNFYAVFGKLFMQFIMLHIDGLEVM